MYPLIIIQARMGGERFPGKVLKPLLGQPMLLWMLERLENAYEMFDLIVACPDTETDRDVLKPILERHGYTVRCVPDIAENDVLGRFAAICAEWPRDGWVLRLTGDCPFIDPWVVDAFIRFGLNNEQYQFVGAGGEWADGVADIDMMHATTLMEANKKATEPADREHVTPYIWKRPQTYKQYNIPCPFDLSAYNFSVDTPYDLAQAEKLMRSLLRSRGFGFTWRDVMAEATTDGRTHAWATNRRRNAAYVKQVGASSWEDVRFAEGEPVE